MSILTKSNRYKEKIQNLKEGDGNDRRLANVCEAGVQQVAQSNPKHQDHIREYYLPYYRIRFNMVSSPVKDDGKYSYYYQYIENQDIGIFQQHRTDIVHSLWINDNHCLHETFKEHQSWDKDKCATKFVNIKNGNDAETLEVFDMPIHYGVYNNNHTSIGDPYISVTLGKGSKVNENSEEHNRQYRTNISLMPIINEQQRYECHGIEIPTEDKGQLEDLLTQLTSELSLGGYGLKISIYSPEERIQLQTICDKLGYNYITKDEDYGYFIN